MRAARSVSFLVSLALSACGAEEIRPTETIAFSLSEPALEFEPTALGRRSAPIEISAVNSGQQSLELSASSTAEHFVVAPSQFTLAPGERQMLRVFFAPRALGVSHAKLTLSANRFRGIEAKQSTLIGFGHEANSPVTVFPQSLRFGNTVVGTTRVQTFAFTHEGDTAVPLNVDLLDNMRRCDEARAGATFCLGEGTHTLENGTLTLSPGETARFQIHFTPDLSDVIERGALQFSTCERCRTRRLVVEGRGVDTGLSCAPAVHDFGLVGVGSCRAAEVRCWNSANQSLTIAGWSSDRVDPLPIELSILPLDAATALERGDELTLTARFCPSANRRFHGAANVETTDGDRVQVNFRGAGGGPVVSLEPDALDFGEMAVISASRWPIDVVNRGTEPLLISGIEVIEYDGLILVPETTALSVEAGEAQSLELRARATRPGPVSAKIRWETNDPERPVLVTRIEGSGVHLGPCQLGVSSTSLDLGRVARGGRIERGVTLSNDGGIDCLVSGAYVRRGGAFFTDGDARATRLAPGETRVLRVGLNPSQLGEATGEMRFNVSDPAAFHRTLSVRASVSSTPVLVAPAHADWVDPSCASSRRVTLVNRTEGPIDVLGARGLDRFVLSGATLPRRVDAGQTFDLLVSSNATGAVAEQLELDVAGVEAFTVSAGLFSEPRATHIESFRQNATQRADLLFVVDFSTDESLRDEFLSGLTHLITRAEEMGVDYQIGVTSTDLEAEAGALITVDGQDIVRSDALPNPESLARSLIQGRPPSPSSPAASSGIEAAFLALAHPTTSLRNAGLLREDAHLSVAFVSGTEDRSPESIALYQDMLRRVKGRARRDKVTIAAIGGDRALSCLGDRYQTLARRTGGPSVSSCGAGLTSELADHAEALLGRRSSFPLEHLAEPSTLHITIDGRLVPRQSLEGSVLWRYNAEANAVDFVLYGAPRTGAQIQVEYETRCP